MNRQSITSRPPQASNANAPAPETFDASASSTKIENELLSRISRKDNWDRAVGTPLTPEQLDKANDSLAVIKDYLRIRYSKHTPVLETSHKYAVVTLSPEIKPTKVGPSLVAGIDNMCYGKFSIVDTCSTEEEARLHSLKFIKNVDSTKAVMICEIGSSHLYVTHPNQYAKTGLVVAAENKRDLETEIDRTSAAIEADAENRKLQQEKELEEEARAAGKKDENIFITPEFLYWKAMKESLKIGEQLRAEIDKMKKMKEAHPDIENTFHKVLLEKAPGVGLEKDEVIAKAVAREATLKQD